jgi:ribosome-binding protein aMBF1 (putative translation factor)
MAVCKSCGEEVDSFVMIKVDGKNKKVCEECADKAREAGEIAEESEKAVRGMMEYKGTR